ncbi:MAG: OmpA family protein [Treponema sp.]|nr:OmpA family protein [Treponema sp.]
MKSIKNARKESGYPGILASGKRDFIPKKTGILVIFFLVCIGALNAQTTFPSGDYWALNVGPGMNGILVKGAAYQLVIDPRLWLSPPLMVGVKAGINYSTEKNSGDSNLSNIFTFEGQAYLRWNFLRLGQNENRKTNIFMQGGLGLISAYRGTKNPFNNPTITRGSFLAELAAGATIPLTDRWHLEPQLMTGYPHLYGISLTAGYKFPLPQKTKYQSETEYVEVIKTLPASEIVKRIMISAVEFILFGPDIGRYNIGIDKDAQQLNELVLNEMAQKLKDNPNMRVRIEGHANPFTINVSEAEELMVLSAMRADVVAKQLRDRGVSDDQIVIVSFGGTRTSTSDWDVRNRNRRVEMILIQVDLDQ